MSDEHIWPQALGGRYAPSIFRTREVCRDCNSLAGQWVDGPFVKSFLLSLDRGLSAHDYLDPKKPSAAPLFYGGFDKAFPAAPQMVCERWAGLAGEHIYHVHSKDRTQWETFAGGDFIARKSDPGRVYIYLTSPSTYWSLTALFSIVERFPKARYRCLTAVEGLSNLGIAMPSDPPSSKEEAFEIEWIKARPIQTEPNHVTIDIHFAERFMAKLSLGLTHTVLGERATFSQYGDRLRSLLWSKDGTRQDNFGISGSGFWAEPNEQAHVPDFLKWKGAWSLFLNGFPEGYGVTLTTPGGRLMSMMMSDNPSTWRPDLELSPFVGAVFIFVPQRNKTFGPLPMDQYIAHRSGFQPLPELLELEIMRSGLHMLPSKTAAEGAD